MNNFHPEKYDLHPIQLKLLTYSYGIFSIGLAIKYLSSFIPSFFFTLIFLFTAGMFTSI